MVKTRRKDGPVPRRPRAAFSARMGKGFRSAASRTRRGGQPRKASPKGRGGHRYAFAAPVQPASGKRSPIAKALAYLRQLAGQGYWPDDIRAFHKKFGHPVGCCPQVPDEKVVKLRFSLIEEETSELLKGIHENDLAQIADGAADSIVVILGTLTAYGIDPYPIWQLVHTSNMAKLPGNERSDGKILKPEGWKPPDIAGEIARQRLGCLNHG